MRVAIMNQPGGRFVSNNVTLKQLIAFGYAFRDSQLVGGPAWITADRWNIEAKAEEGSIPPPSGPPDPNVPTPIGIRLQSLLEDRFQLRTHRESRELPIYVLTVFKDGLKMKSVDAPPRPTPGQPLPPPPPPPPPGAPGGGLPQNFTPPPGMIMVSPAGILASAANISQIVNLLSGRLGRPVIDKTGLKGFFDVRLEFAPESAPGGIGPIGPPPGGPPVAPPSASDPAGPSIFTAVQEQLGLKLESTKGPVDVLVIDNVQKPAEN
jgi:uncharacterized protein (TIGR03435 family)